MFKAGSKSSQAALRFLCPVGFFVPPQLMIPESPWTLVPVSGPLSLRIFFFHYTKPQFSIFQLACVVISLGNFDNILAQFLSIRNLQTRVTSSAWTFLNWKNTVLSAFPHTSCTNKYFCRNRGRKQWQLENNRKRKEREGGGEGFRGKKVAGRLIWCWQKMRKGVEGILKQKKKLKTRRTWS